ncbi:MAG: group 1 glycosyl transferase [Rhodocyclaceae bacterium]|nr:MAG: group 1 glycosyl transferase [Rhodocyclaceae bacterium]TND05567.1 MAG: group 1 glycosyl transferase [Rhodocyclaceae bacterium]
MIIIQANSIHESGGKSLLLSVLKSLDNLQNDQQVVVFLDQRFDRNALAGLLGNARISIKSVIPSVFSRLSSEIAIWRLTSKNRNATLLCFGNLPPLLPCDARVIVYFHTVLYFRKFGKYVSGFRSKAKRFVESAWIRSRLGTVDHVYVQSSFVKECLCREFGMGDKSVTVLPFVDLKNLKSGPSQARNPSESRFFYPALGTPHKNHKLLVDAWILLARQNIFPLLVLTIDARFESLLAYLEKARLESNLRIVNLGLISHEEVLNQLMLSQAMIFPSLSESFGLPLLEARENDVPVISGELDYVRDILNPVETFDPESALSISRAIKRFLKIRGNPIEVSTPDSFVDLIAGS